MMTIVAVLLIAGLLDAVVVGVAVPKPTLSLYEMQRLVNMGNEVAKKQQLQERYSPELSSFLRIVQASIISIAAIIVCVTQGWLWAIAAVFIVLILGNYGARTSVIKRLSHVLQRHLVGVYVAWFEQYTWLHILFAGPRLYKHEPSMPHSREELLHMIEHSQAIKSNEERKLLLCAVRFDDYKVDDIMVSRDSIHTIKKRELLGPLVLDDLHKTGHKRFPVIGDSVDDILGILHVSDLLVVDSRAHSATAEKAMEKGVNYIHVGDSLRAALGAFLYHHHHLLIVIDDEGKTAGLVTIEDVIEALFGKRLEDSVV